MSHKHEPPTIEEAVWKHVPIDPTGWLKDHPGNGSLFESIARAAGELKAEADRVSTGDRDLKKTITCGELQEILTNTTKAVLGLRCIEFQPYSDRTGLHTGASVWSEDNQLIVNLRSEIGRLENLNAQHRQKILQLESRGPSLEDRLSRVEKEIFGDAPR